MKHVEFDPTTVPVAGNVDSITLREWTPQQYAAELKLVSLDEQIHTSKEGGYYFISFEDIIGNRTHVYLSKGLSEELETMENGTTAPMILKGRRIQEVLNADGEIRLKLTRGGSTKVDLNSLFSGW